MSEQSVQPAFFDGVAIRLLDPPDTPADRLALENFLVLRPADRLAASRHVHAYYLDFIDYTGDGAIHGGVPGPEAIWDHVRPRAVFVDHDDDSPGNSSYVVIEAECDWEREHGLMLCFLEGKVLAKCGAYDGHLTNSAPVDDPDLASIVYSAHDSRFTTRRDP